MTRKRIFCKINQEYKYMLMVIIMTKNELETLKSEIEELRQEINTYIQYPDIFKDELLESSQKIDLLINKYITLSK